MSLKPFFLNILLVSIVLFASCEDNKNASEAKKNSNELTVTDSISAENNKKQDSTKNETSYPKITQENVEAFLTKYGDENPETKVLITTQHGIIELELFEDTPLHRANFIYLVKQKYFDGTFFHRIVPNFIIQGGNSDLPSTPKKRTEIGKDYLLPAEIHPERHHTYGTVSGAKEYRENPDKKSAPFEFFIFLGPLTSTTHLNGNYTVFGKVSKGMDVVEKIANLDNDGGDWPVHNVYIEIKIIE